MRKREIELAELLRNIADDLLVNVYHSFQRSRNILIGVVMETFLLTAVISFFIIRSITKPINDLTKVAEEIACGNFGAKARVATKDEIGILGKIFNFMAEQFKEFQDQLKKQIQELKELDQLKDDFLNNTTHELKTPLVPIKLQTQLLLSDAYGDLNEEQKESVEMILRNENWLESLISDVMDISRSDSKQLKLVFMKEDFGSIVAEAVENMKTAADERKIELVLKPIPELPRIHLDAKRIAQVAGNLLSNALKFTPKGGKITVEVEKDEGKVVTKITDTGIER